MLHLFSDIDFEQVVHVIFEQKHDSAKDCQPLRNSNKALELVWMLVQEGIHTHVQNQKHICSEQRPCELRCQTIICNHE